MEINNIDIFCEVIDNYGDVGVAYRLAREFKRIYPSKKLRFIINQTEEINLIKKSNNIEIIAYKDISKIENSADLIIETFGCEIPKEYMDKALKSSKLIINLEYFSAEDWVDDFHLQESFLGGNLKKYFFIPGLSKKSGGVLLDNEFLERKKKVEENTHIKKLESFLEKYCPNNKGLKETFINYNINRDNFSYFFKNFKEIERHNKNYTNYLRENCNLMEKLIKFIENIGGKN